MHNRSRILNSNPEKERVARLSRIRQVVFGSLDGLLVPLGVVSAVAGGTGNSRAVIIAGLADAFAGALSMAAGEFISGRTEAQVHKAEVDEELQGMRTNPEYEFRELVLLLEHEGVKSEDAFIIAEKLQQNPHSYAKTMVEKELGLDIEPATIKLADSFVMGFSYIAASIVPLVSYFFIPVEKAYILSLILSVLFLIILGLVRGRMSKINLFVSVLEILAVGIFSGIGGYYLGIWLPKLFGY